MNQRESGRRGRTPERREAGDAERASASDDVTRVPRTEEARRAGEPNGPESPGAEERPRASVWEEEGGAVEEGGGGLGGAEEEDRGPS